MGLVTWLDRRFYPNHGDNWDDSLFREKILEALRPEDRVLDVGAGAGIIPALDFRGLAAEVYGIDPDERVVDNPMLDEAKVALADDIPYPDDHFDLAFADNVLEHLADPDVAFGEICRVLKPGGRFLVKTPNKYHYVATLARLTPHWFHGFYNELRGRRSEDTFPTLYRANTRQDVTRLAQNAGLDVEWIEMVEARPEYLRLSTPTYVGGILYERFVNRFEALEPIRVVLVASLRKRLDA